MSAPRPVAASADLVVLPNPLTLQGRTITRMAELRPGDTLAEFLQRAGLDLAADDWRVSIGGAHVPALMWARTRPYHGQLIEVRREAHGRDVLRLAAVVALTYFTFGTGTTLGASLLGAGTFGAWAVNSAIYLAGSVLINKLLPPARAGTGAYQEQTASQTYSLSGGRNRARPYEPLGLLFGTTRVVPDYAAQPYSWFEANDQFQYVRLHAGINCGSVAGLKIGTTAIGSFTDVDVKQSGFPGTSTKLDDWPNVDTIAGGTVDAPTAPGSYVTRTSSAGSVRLAVDLAAQLYDMAPDGTFNTATITLEIEKRLLPSGAWSALSTFGTTVYLTSGSAKPVRLTVVSGTLTAGQYEVRVRKMVANVSTSRAANAVEWVSLKSYQQDNTDYSAHPQVGIRIKASGQINGVLDEVSWIATSAAVPVWNGTAWVTQTTSNPGAHILRFARGIFDPAGRLMAGLGLADAQIDIETLKAFMVKCAYEGDTFDHFFDSAVSCQDALEAMANAGRGSISWHPGTLSVVWADGGQPVEAVVSMGNVRQGTFRVDYATRSSAEEVELTYFDAANDYQSASVRVLAPGVTVPRETARLSPAGVTTQTGALWAARFSMAQNIYQRKTVSWEMDLEHLTFRRYSIVALSHDMTQWGYSGRLKAAVSVSGTVTITLDDEVPWNSSASARRVGLRIPGETGYRIFQVATFSGTTRTLTLVGTWPGGVPFPGDSAGNPVWDTIWIYDFKTSPGQRLRVASIEPAAGLTGARITAVPEPDEFWTYVTSGAYTIPPSTAAPQAVVASNLHVAQRQLEVNYQNQTELSLSFDVSGPYDHAQVWGAPDGETLRLLGETRTATFPGVVVGNDGIFNLEVRPFDQLGRVGTTATEAYSVSLATAVPATAGVSLVDDGNVAVFGGSATKVGGVDGAWDAGFHTQDSYTGGAYISFVPAQNNKYLVVGLNGSSDLTDPGVATINFGMYARGDGYLRYYESGTPGTFASNPTYAAGDVLAVLDDLVNVRYFQNGTLLRTTASPGGTGARFGDGSMLNIDAAVTNIQFGPMSSNEWAAIGGRPAMFRACTWGSGATTFPPSPSGVSNAETGSSLAGNARSYTLTLLNRTTGALISTLDYDVYGVGAVGSHKTAADLATALNAISGNNTIVVVCGYDEPMTNRLTSGLAAAMYRHGASRAVFGSPQFAIGAAYILIGIANCGEANGFESYQGASAYDTSAWCDVSFYLQNGQLVISGAGATPRTLADYSYIGDLNATATVLLVSDGNVTISGSTVSKTGGTSGSWDAGFHSKDSFTGGAYVSFVPAQTNAYLIVGLNGISDLTNPGEAGIDHGLYVRGDGVLRAYESGSIVSFGDPAYTTTDALAVTDDGVNVRYYQNGTVLRTTASAGTGALYADGSFFTSGGKVTNIQFGPMSSNLWTNLGGTGKPADGATKNTVTKSYGAPSSPTDGDIWLQTDVTGAVLLQTYYRSGGAWVLDPKVINLTLSPAAVTLPADAAGVVSDFSGGVIVGKVMVGSTDDTSNWTASRTDGSGMTSSVSGATVTISAMTVDSGYIDITFARTGYPSQTLRVSVTKARSAAAGSGTVTGLFIYSDAAGVAPRHAGVRFNADGTIQAKDASGTYQAAGNWYSPTTSGIGSSYWIKMHATGTAFSSGTMDTWVSLASAQAWLADIASGVSVHDSTGDYQISGNSSGTLVVASGTIEAVADTT